MRLFPQKERKRHFSDVRAEHAGRSFDWIRNVFGERVVNLRPTLLHAYPVLVPILVVVLIGVGFTVRRLLTNAKVVDFYPATCLGTWQNPQGAQGEPETFADEDLGFTNENSALFSDETSEMFCGGFLPQEFTEEGEITDVAVTLVWDVEQPFETDAAPSGAPPASEAPAEPEAPPAPEVSAPPVSRGGGGLSLTLLAIAPIAYAQEAPVAEPPPADTSAPPETPPPPDPSASSLPPIDSSPSASSSNGQEGVQNANEVSAEPQDGETIPEEPESVPLDSETERDNQGTLTATSTPPATSTIPESFPAADPEDENFLDVRYSLDGQSWFTLQKVSLENWQNLTIPISIRSWDELRRLQVSVRGIPTNLKQLPVVRLDGFLLGVKFDVAPLFGEAVIHDPVVDISGLPVLTLPTDLNDLRPIEPKRTFRGSESPSFEFDFQQFPIVPSPALESEQSTSTATSTDASAAPVSGDTPPDALPAEPSIEVPPREEINQQPVSWFDKLFSFFGMQTRAQAQTNDNGAAQRAAGAPSPPLPPYPPTHNRPVVADVIGPDREPALIEPVFIFMGDRLRVTVATPTGEFRPGKYTLRLWFYRGDTIYYSEQDFTWGVLAVNVNKSMYTVGDAGWMGFAVLDDGGHTLCGAHLAVTLTSPGGGTQSFSTDGGTIMRSKTCGPTTITNEPDYRAEFTANEEGVYLVHVTAQTVNGVREIDDTFQAKSEPAFDVERMGPTRIYPPSKYLMTIRITARQHYNGMITETVPNSFTAWAGNGGYAVVEGDERHIKWLVDMKKGDVQELSYILKAPEVSPEFYKLGPLVIGHWQEVRWWQIASDAANTVILISSVASTTWSLPLDWNNSSNTIEVIGAGGGGRTGSTAGSSGGAGGGYSKLSNLDLGTATSVAIQVGSSTVAGTTGGDSFFSTSTTNITCATSAVCAKGGVGGTANTSSSCVATATSSAVGTTKQRGGDCGGGYSTGDSGGGGGSAAGSTGDGKKGGEGRNASPSSGGGGAGAAGGVVGGNASGTNGADGGNNDQGAGRGLGAILSSGTRAATGTVGGGGGGGGATSTTASFFGNGAGGGPGRTMWTDTVTNATSGPGGGGGGAGSISTNSTAAIGGSGANYGGGGGGGENGGGTGAQGIIIVTYTALPNAAPTLSSVSLNGGSDITLISNATKTITLSFSVTDTAFGCADVFTSGRVTTTVFRSGVSSSCGIATVSSSSLSLLNCYSPVSLTNSCSGNATSANATATFELWYFADATDASSSYPSNTWQAFIQVTDASASSTNTTTVGVELNTLLAIDVVSSTSYGSLNPGSDTGATNTIVSVKNAGNSSSGLQLSGTALTSGANSIATSSQHYGTSTFTFGGAEQTLQQAATTVAGFLIPRPSLTIWSDTTALPSVRTTHGFVANNGYVYVIGGFDTVATSSVLFAPINSTGSIGAWSSTTALPATRDEHASVVNNGYVYAIGGFDSGAATSSVFFAPVSATGSIGAWSSTTALPAGRYRYPAVVYNGYVYAIGGLVFGGVATSSVLFAPINSTGSIGAWSSTTALPLDRYNHPAVVNNGYVYAIGGRDFGDAATSSVFFALVNSTGSIGVWTSTTALPVPRYWYPAAVNNGFVYAIGGNDSAGTATSSVLFAPVNASGSIGAWSLTTALPAARAEHPAVVNNGFVYLNGGLVSPSVYTSSVLYSSLSSRDTYWGVTAPLGTASGTYTGLNTFTAIFQP